MSLWPDRSNALLHVVDYLLFHSCAVIFVMIDMHNSLLLYQKSYTPALYWYAVHTLCPAVRSVLSLRRTMSGRLIILPKKSWHPGKRENIEKVLRDERLASEEAAQAQERARELTQESIIETLSKKRHLERQKEGHTQGNQAPGSRKRGCTDAGKGCDEGPGGEGQGWGATSQHVNLFSEAELEAKKQLGQNADYQREKQEEELKAQRRSGLAPTALGDGSAELKDADSQPWYTQVKASEGATRTTRLGREVTGEEAAEALKRDDKRKSRADPLGSLFKVDPHPYPHHTGTSNKDRVEQSVTPNSTPSAESRGQGQGASPKEGARKKSSKKEKKHKKHKKHKKRKSSLDGNTGADDDYSRGDSGDSTTEVARQQLLDDLRRRRLAREGGERERQIRLLAERQMAGLPLPDERRMTYNNQYNATVARQNRQQSFHKK